jgi:hypothetical protein
MATAALNELKNGQGFVLGPPSDDPEVAWLRDFVQRKWRTLLIARYLHLAAEIESTPIHAYHKLAPRIDHASMWTKEHRLFRPDEVAELMARLTVFRFLREAFGPYEVADIEGLGYPEIYWRLVRPNHADDVAGAHADSWFYTLTNHLPPAEQQRLVKVWLPVYSEPRLSGLAMVAQSQKMALAYTGEMRHGRLKPLMTDPREAELEMTNLPLQPGQCVAFHVDTLHRGIGHKTDQSRVSIEFAIRLSVQ